MEEIEKLNGILFDLAVKLQSLMPRIIIGLIILGAFILAGIILQYLSGRISRRFKLPPEVCSLLQQVVKASFIIMGIITSLGTMGINVSAMVAALGLSGFALGFALRDTVSNVASGVLLLVYRPFSVGDRIGVMAFEGEVTEIDLRYTVIEMENKKVLIPNSTLFNTPVNVFNKGSEAL